MATKTQSVKDDTNSTSLAELDPDQLTDSDRLYYMAQAMRDEDNLFKLPVVDWETKGKAVLVEIVTPDGTTATVQQDWPDKPTEDNDFVRTCMCALDIDDPKSAALMADELQDVNHDEFTVPADKDYHGWELKPEADMQKPLRSKWFQSEEDQDNNHLTLPQKVIALLVGPIALLGTAGMGVMPDEPGKWFDPTESGADTYWFAQVIWYGLLGTIGYGALAPLLL